MSISSQLPPIPLTQAGASLAGLAQAAGQTVEARVLTQTPAGLAQLRIGPQTLELALPGNFAPGTTLNFAVQQAEGQLRLVLLAATPPAAGGSSGATPPTGTAATMTPATTLDLSATARAAQQPAPSAPVPQEAPASGGMPVAPPAGNAPTPTASPVGTTLTATSGVASSSPSPVAPPVASGPAAVATSAMPAMPAGSAPATAGVAVAPVSAGPAVSVSVGVGAVPGVAASMPYAAMPPVSGVASPFVSTPAAEPPSLGVAAMSPSGQQGRAPPSVAGQAPAAPAAGSPAPPSASSPQAALVQMVQQALPRQTSVVALTLALSAAVGRVALPPAVAKAAQQVLGQRLALDGADIDGPALQRAIRGSGVMQESLLAAGRPAQAAGDMKSALLSLRQNLLSWLGSGVPVEPVAALPPPWRGVTPRARQGEPPPAELPADPREAGKVLLERTEGALARLRLHQSASLPDPATPRPDTQLSLDLPVLVGGQQLLLHLQIHGEPEEEAGEAGERGWQVRFAINLAGLGEVGAQISLRGRNTGVLLWTEQPEAAALLAEEIDALKGDLEALGLRPGAVVVRGSVPPAAASPAASGHYLDATR